MLDLMDLQVLGTFAMLGATFSALGGVWAWCRGRSPAGSAPVPGQRPVRVGPYALGVRLGAGAMGEVYRARHTGSGRLCAVKLLPRSASDREQRQFDNEVRLGSRLHHDHAVTVHEHGKASDGTRYFAMELVEGLSLQELVERDGPQPAARVIEILRQVCTALAAAHEQGLVHRDVKPSNIVLTRGEHGEDVAKLLDFGLVKHVEEPLAHDAEEHIVGTPLYISPEAITMPQAVDARSDLYGLGAVAHFLLSGAPVFDGKSVIEVCSQHLSLSPEPLSELVGWAIGSDLEQLVLDCLAKDPSARPDSARELARRLARCADAEPSFRAPLPGQLSATPACG